MTQLGKMVLYDAKGNIVTDELQQALNSAIDLLQLYLYDHNERAHAGGHTECICRVCVEARRLTSL